MMYVWVHCKCGCGVAARVVGNAAMAARVVGNAAMASYGADPDAAPYPAPFHQGATPLMTTPDLH